jgi:hypothetical protein
VPIDSGQVRGARDRGDRASSGLDIPLRRGRLFLPTDLPSTLQVALINETLARRFFAGQDPVGRRIVLGFLRQSVELEIIGIVGDVRRHALNQAARPAISVPHAQVPLGATGWVVRDPRSETVQDAAKRAIWSLNATCRSRPTTLERLVGDSLRWRRFLLAFLIGFAAVTLTTGGHGDLRGDELQHRERTRRSGAHGVRPGVAGCWGWCCAGGRQLAAGGVALRLLGAFWRPAR